MNLSYIQLLPTVFVRADAFPGLQAFQAAQTGAAGVHSPADDWDDEPTKPDRVLPAGLRQQLQAAQSPADLPAHIERELASRYEVEPREMRQLKSWMNARSLRVNHFSKAVDYLSQMRLAAAQELIDDEPTVRIDLRKKENRHALISQTVL
ncbi:MAG TPA: hypothetical protein VFX30_11165 [bacterium]|nr:hypothetical protein [bacterium]